MEGHVRRRDFIKVIAGSVAVWPLVAHAQQSNRLRRVGLLMGYPVGDAEGQANLAVFRRRLEELGWILSGKYVQFGIELGKPQAPIDYLWHTEWPDGKNRLDATTQAAQSLGVEVRARGFVHIDDANDVLAAMKSAGAVAIVVQPSPLTNKYRGQLIASGMAHGLGMIMAWPVAAREGALIGYGPDYNDMYRRVGVYILRIIKGEKPANLPVQEPTKFPLLINAKSAKAIGISFPPTLIVAADEVIE